MKAAVVIPTFRDSERLLRCLSAVSVASRAAGASGVEVCVIVVDNEPSTSVAEHVSAFQGVRYVPEPKPGSYAARNTGVAEARQQGAQVVGFTDSDCVPKPTWIVHGVCELDITRAEAVGGHVEPFVEVPVDIVSCAAALESITAFPVEDYVRRHHFAPTANLWITMEAWDAVGPFDHRLLSGGDKEWCQRLVRLGGTLKYCDDVRVAHPVRHDMRDLLTKVRRIAGGQFTAAGQQGLFELTRFGLRALRPSLRQWLAVATTPSVALGMRLRAAFALATVDAVRVVEAGRLLLGGQAVR